MKIRVSTVSGFASVSAVVLAGMLMSGCSTTSPEVLKERPYIPAPSSSDEVMVDKVTTEKIAVDITVPDDHPPIGDHPSDLPPLEPVKAKPIEYKVKKGDSFWSIARKFGVSKEELAAYNNISLKKTLYAGKVLNIPPGGYATPADKLPPAKRPESRRSVGVKTSHKAVPADGKYTVKRGDTLGGIAHRFGVKLRVLAQANGISKPYMIRVGQKLVIPEGSVKLKSTPVTPKTTPKKAPADSIDHALSGISIDPQPATQPKKPEIKDQSPEDILKSIDVGDGKSEKAMLEELNLGSVETRNVGVDENTTIEQFAAKYGVSVSDVKKYNPDFGADGKIPKGSIVVIPK